jgi:ABC-type transport system involved in multi-copper enzyme maturation permease subunit
MNPVTIKYLIMKPISRSLLPASALGYARAACFMALIVCSLLSAAATKIIHTQPSEFAPVLVFEE